MDVRKLEMKSHMHQDIEYHEMASESRKLATHNNQFCPQQLSKNCSQTAVCVRKKIVCEANKAEEEWL